jgi:multimeric flavodoxin WrbA
MQRSVEVRRLSMKVTTLLASPHPVGNTSTILGWVEESLRRHGNKVTRVSLADKAITPCKACYACSESETTPGCVLQDDAHAVFDAMIAADAILFATPLYMWSYAAPLKLLLDRCLCLARGYATSEHRSFVEGRATALLVTCGGAVDNNADAIQTAFPRFADYLRLENKGVFVFPHCTSPDRFPNTYGKKAVDLSFCLTQCQAEGPRG